jgi:hypothetical protein
VKIGFFRTPGANSVCSMCVAGPAGYSLTVWTGSARTPMPRMKRSRIWTGSRCVVDTARWLSMRAARNHGASALRAAANCV